MILIKKSLDDESFRETFYFSFDAKKKRVIVEAGKTSIMCHLVISSEEISRSFSSSGCKPLTVSFESRFNAINKIPGGFRKKDSFSDFDVVLSRLVDRCLRPLIPEDFNRDIKIYLQVLSYKNYSLDVLSVLASSLALCLFGVISSPVSLCKISGDKINSSNRTDSKIRFLAAFSSNFSDASNNLEDLTENIMIDYECLSGVKLDKIDSYRSILEESFKITSSLAKNMNKLQLSVLSDLKNNKEYAFKKYVTPSIGFFARRAAWSLSKKIFNSFFTAEGYSSGLKTFELSCKNDYVYSSYVRDLVSYRFSQYVFRYNKRLDSRPLFNSSNLQADIDIREHYFINNLVSSQHGCNLFSRGETEVVSSICVADSANVQYIDSLDGKFSESFIVNYNFLPHLTEENRKAVGFTRREIGHSELIKKALKCLILDDSKVVRLVSDVVACDGSSSMSAVCGASILLYQNKLISQLVAGISIGLIKYEDKKNFIVDLTHIEDEFLSLVDCKITGTRSAITAIQLDSKKTGLTYKDFNELLKVSIVKLEEVLSSMESLLDSKNVFKSVNVSLLDSEEAPHRTFKINKRDSYGSLIRDAKATENFKSKHRYDYNGKEGSFTNNKSHGRFNKTFSEKGESSSFVSKENQKQYNQSKEQQTNDKKFNQTSKLSETVVLNIDTNFFRESLVRKDITISWLAKKLRSDIRVEGDDKLRVSSYNASYLADAVKFIRHLVKN